MKLSWMQSGSSDSGNERSRDIVRGITRLAASMQFHVVAEFVETREQMELLKALHCDIYQGYYYGKPCTVYEFNYQII